VTDPRPFGPDLVLTDPVGGSVWRATRPADGMVVAVKLVGLSTTREVIDARIAADLAALTAVRQRNVVSVLHLVVDGPTLGIVMEWVDGPNLLQERQRRATVPAVEAARIVAYTCAGLAALHGQGLVHRDVCPKKVLLAPGEVDASGQPGPTVPRLTDFAVARLSDGPDRACSIRNEPSRDYVAPETLTGRLAGPAADVYGAGTMLYELLSGHTPFGGGSLVEVLRRQVEEPVAPLPVAAPLWTVLERMLAKDPAARPDARTAALALADFSEGLVPADLPPAPPPAASPGGPVGAGAPGGPDPQPTVALASGARPAAVAEPGATVIRRRPLEPAPAVDPKAKDKGGLVQRLFHRRKP